VVLLGSSATNPANRWFYPAAVALIVWAIAAARPPRFPRWSFVLFAALAAGGGYFGHTQLREVQSRLESAFVNWLGGAIRRPGTSAREARTALGQIGRLKLSGRIVLHVEPETGEPPPLLREASYNSLQRNTYWYNTNRSFERVPLEANDVWKLLPKKKTTRAVTVSASLERGAGILALPAGAAQLENLLVGEVGTNILGVVRVAEGPGLVSYRASYGPGQTIDSEPGPTDLAVPEGEKAALSEIVAQLDLASKTDAEKLRLIAGFFQNNFKYSTWLAAGNSPMESETPVTRFLRTTRSGHCEFFATATTLLLRQARIPARYAVGYAVMESAKSGRTFLVRERHAHAWTLVWNKDRRIWEDFDTTPASWDAVESENASFWEPLADFWSAVKYQLARMRWGKTNYRQYLVWALVPMILFLAWRIIFNRQRKRARLADEAVAVARDWPGLDSEFYLVEQKLAQRGFQRWENETLADWLGRIQKTSTDSVDGLRAILPLHYRYRFDPRGLTAEERRDLGRKVKSWLAT
jgi:transglutaminase-like putative cysteine protease